jgi:SMC interacting uncharacterized protein involved in chromosome segregation
MEVIEGSYSTMENEKYIMMLQETTDKANRNEGRIKKLETESEVLHQLVTNVAVMVEQMKSINQKVTKLDNEFEEIKEKPVKRYDTLVTAIITALVSALIGFFLRGFI